MSEKAKLTDVADKALERANSEATATRMLTSAVVTDSGLLMQLYGLSRTDVHERAVSYLRERAEVTRGGVSRSMSEIQSTHGHPDPASSNGSRASRQGDGSLSPTDRSAVPSTRTGGASPAGYESQLRDDRPVRLAPKGVPAAARQAAMTVAKTVFDDRIHATTDIRWGDITPRDYDNLRIRNAFTREIEKGLEPIIRRAPAPDAALRDYADPEEVESIRKAAEAARDRTLSAVKGVSHAR